MVELELLGLHSDGEHLVLTDPRGERYRVRIDDALRAAVRRDRPHLEQLQAERESVLRPKEIQALVRAGARATEIAEQHGLAVEQVRRYEGPVLAERAWVVQQAQAVRINHDVDAPQLGDTVVDRLAARGVSPSALDWNAVRSPGQPWEVAVTFVVDGKEREARWRVDLSARTVHAVDDEARWLSETEVGPGPAPRRRLSTVVPRGEVFDQDTRPDQTESLLAHLAESRGTRTQPEVIDEEPDEAPLWDEGAHPAASRPEEAVDAHVLPLRGPRAVADVEPDDTEPARDAPPAPPVTEPEPATEHAPADEPEQRPRSRKTGRRSVPSWDEIVFGARPE